MSDLLKSRTVIVTGAATGIGQAFALGCVAQGANVVVADLGPADETMATIEKAGGQALYVKCDVADEASTRAMAAAAAQRFGGIDGLVNNAAYFREVKLTDPWHDAPALLAANPSARVPTLLTDAGVPLTESLLIVLWLETQRPQPSLLGADADRVISKAGVAMGAIDAAAAIIISRRIDPEFDTSPVGLRRRRSVAGALERLEAEAPALGDGAANLAVIATVVLLDYIAFRFAGAPWLPATPRLDALAAQARTRASFAETMPRNMPAA